MLAPLYLCFQVDHPDEVVGIMAIAPAKTATVEASVKQAGEKIRCRIWKRKATPNKDMGKCTSRICQRR